MFGTIRRHQKWLWAVIITFTVISFVIYFSPYSKINTGPRGRLDLGTINGERISEEEFANAQREIYVQYFFASGGRMPDEEARRNFDRETLQWLLLIREEEQLGIHIAGEMVAEVARNKLRSLQRSGNVSPEGVARLLEANGFQLEDLERYARHLLGLEELMAAFGLSGRLATPDEIKGLYIREHQELAADAVFFNASNYLASVSVSPEAITQFYSNRLADYRIPERVQVSYVKFPLTNFWAKAEQFWAGTNLNEMVEANYQRLGTNYFKDAKTPEQTRAKIREELIRERARLEARRQANEFARPLFDLSQPRPEDLRALARTNGLTVEVTEPFDRDHDPKGLEVSEDFASAAFKLTPEQPLAPLQVGRDGVYVIAYHNRLPSEVPTLDQIRDQVVADFKYEQALKLARQTGLAFHLRLTNNLAQGKSFTAACAEAKLKPVALPAFSLSTRALPETNEPVNLNLVKPLAFSTPVGKASSFQGTSEGGVILFVKSRLPLDEARMQKELPAFAQAVRQQWQNEVFNEWFGQQFAKGVRSRLLQAERPPPALSPRPGRKS